MPGLIINPAEFVKLAADWRAAGLDPTIADPLDIANQRWHEIASDYRAFRDSTTLVRALAARLASGDITYVDAVAALASSRNRDSALTIYDAARVAVLGQAVDTLVSIGDQLITDHLAPREAELFAAAERPARALGTIASPEEAFAAGKDITGAWHKVADALEVRNLLDNVNRRLRKIGSHRRPILHGRWEHTNPDVDDRPWLTRDEISKSMFRGGSMTTMPDKTVHPVRRFADLVLSDVGPRVLVTEDTDHQPNNDHSASARQPEPEPAA